MLPRTSSPVRITTSPALLACLLGGAVTPVVADGQINGTVAGKTPALLKKKRMKEFKQDEPRKLHYRANVAWKTYEQHRKSEQVLCDQLRWFLADPNEQDSIPVLEQSAAQLLAPSRPIVAKQRDQLNKDLDRVRTKCLTNGCLPSKDAKTAFKEALRYYKRSADNIFKAQGRLFAANMALQTAQADLAGKALQDADLEFATVEENAIRCNELLETLY